MKGQHKYTVVGIHLDDFERDGEDAVYVEWVRATDVESAVRRAKGMYTDREESHVLCVFEGHRIDKLFDKGLEA